MKINQLETSSFNDQRPVTPGLRKKASVLLQPRYLENFAQALIDTQPTSMAGLCSGYWLAGGGLPTTPATPAPLPRV